MPRGRPKKAVEGKKETVFEPSEPTYVAVTVMRKSGHWFLRRVWLHGKDVLTVTDSEIDLKSIILAKALAELDHD